MHNFAKKIVTLAVCLLLSACLSLNCLAVNGLSTSQSQKVSANTTFSVDINLEYLSDTPIMFVSLNIAYPSEYLAVVGHTNGTLFSECTIYPLTAGEYGLYFNGTDSAALDGKLVTISFVASKDFTGSSFATLNVSAKILVDGEDKTLSAFHMVNYSTINDDDVVVDEDDDVVVDEDDDIVVDEDEDIVVDEDEDIVIDEDEDIVIDEDGDVEITVTKATQATTTAKTTAKTTTATTTKITTPATTTTPETTTEPTTEAVTEPTTEAVQTTVTLPTPAPETDASEGEDDAPKKASGGGVIAAAIVIIILSVCAVLGIEYYKAVFIK